jgi:hypothetical protein
MVSSTSGGRNIAVFHAASFLGKFVWKGALSEGEVRDALMDACRSNGVIEDGGKQCHKSITNGLNKARNDSLPQLVDRPRRPPLWKQTQDALISQMMADAEAMPGYYR